MAADSRGVGDPLAGALPTFIIIGAQKCGTTSLAQYLGAHPDVFMTEWKEPQYFNRDEFYERGVEWYRSWFAGAGDARARGEATPSYTKVQLFPGVPARIAALLPDVKLIYLLRDPIDRIRSQYAMNVQKGRERKPIDEAVIDDPNYVGFSLYALQLEQYLEHFDAAQILVLWSDDLKERRGQTLARAFSFIDVDPDAELSRTVLGREFNRVDAQRAPTRLYGPALRLAARTPLTRLSLSSRRRLSRLAQRRIAAPDSTLAPDVEARLWEQIAPDSTRLEALVGDTPPWLRERERSVGG